MIFMFLYFLVCFVIFFNLVIKNPIFNFLCRKIRKLIPLMSSRNSHPEVFYKRGILIKIFFLIKLQIGSAICKITYLTEHLQTAASEVTNIAFITCIIFIL